MGYWVYILKSKYDGSYYIGQTKDLEDRLDRHNSGGVKYTKAKRPWVIVYTKGFPTRSEAVRFESSLKRKKSKRYIEWFIGK